jgi:hypothetical protein
MIKCSTCRYSLVVKQILGKDQRTVQFCLSAPLENPVELFRKESTLNRDSNPFAMPWEDEIWNDPATEKDIVLGYEIGDESFKVTGEKTPDDDKLFIGIDISGFVGIGGGIKIGFNIPV